MLHHRTTDPGLRAWDIATGEAERYYKKTGDILGYSNILHDVLEKATVELLGATESPFPDPVTSEPRLAI
jgi:hypothetical protein